MKITEIRVGIIEGFGDWVLIQVLTDAGIIGLGETFPARPGLGRALCDLVGWMEQQLVGEDPADIDRLYQKLYRHYRNRVGTAAGALTTAIGGVEIALWDILGKELGVPVYRLLGGKFRDRVRVYADFHAGGVQTFEEKEVENAFEPDAYAQRALELVDEGFTALKLDLDVPLPYYHDKYNRSASNAEIRHLVSLVSRVRETVGPDIDLAADCHCAFDVPSAIKLAQALEPFELLFLEEPVPQENVKALAQVSSATSTPICVGENLFTRFGFQELLEEGAAQIIMPDVQKSGGLLECKRIADMAFMHYIPVAPHCVVSPVGTMASVHACASMANFLILEYHMAHIPWWQDMIEYEEDLVQAGYMAVPAGPGLGVRLNANVVREHMREGSLVL